MSGEGGGGVLARERALREASERVFRWIEAPLRGHLIFRFPDEHRVAPTPDLFIRFPRIQRNTRVRGLRTAFRASVMLFNHSRRLQAFPKLKVEFWTRVLQTPMMMNSPPMWDVGDPMASRRANGIEDWVIEREEFPSFKMNCSFRMSRDDELSAQGMEALLEAMTTPLPLDLLHLEPPIRGLDLQFPTMMTLESLKIVQRFLEKLYAHPDRQFRVSLLSISLSHFKRKHMSVLAEIFKSNSEVYKIPEISLDWFYCGDIEMSGLGPVLSAICTPWSSGSSATRSMKLNDCTLRADQVGIVCSALRYASGMDEFMLEHFSDDLSEPIECTQCWRWIAFALFFSPTARISGPRSQKRRWVSLARNTMTRGDFEAFRRTLRNPAELVYQGSEELPAVSSLEVVAVREGSSFHAESSTSSSVLLVLTADAGFEALCEQDGWLCVVIPAHGFGWIQTTQARLVTSEAGSIISSAAPFDRGELHVRFSVAVIDMDSRSADVFRDLVQLIGPQLSGLEMIEFSERNCDYTEVLSSIASENTSLKSLVLQGCVFSKRCAHQLLTELSGVLGRDLVVLDLNEAEFDDENDIERFSEILLLPDAFPVLQELHLDIRSKIPLQALKNIFDSLRMRKNLVTLELDWLKSSHVGPEVFNTFQESVAEYQNELLCVKSQLTLAQKFALISVIYAERADSTTMRHKMDSMVLAMIFRYAGEKVHRRIMLTKYR